MICDEVPAFSLRARRIRQGGFTLIEVLISLSLLSLILVGMFSALSTVGATGERLESRAVKADQFRIVSGFLRGVLGSARSATYRQPGRTEERPFFEGARHQVRWIGQMPARHGLGGLSQFRLAVREQQGGRALMLQIAPFDPLQPEPNWSEVDESELVFPVEEFAIGYQALEGGEWQESWGRVHSVPGSVSIKVVAGGRGWPLLVIGLSEARPEVRP